MHHTNSAILRFSQPSSLLPSQLLPSQLLGAAGWLLLSALIGCSSGSGGSDCDSPYGCIEMSDAEDDAVATPEDPSSTTPDDGSDTAPPAASPARRVGYLPTYRGLSEWNGRLDYSRLTHLSVAFANPDANNNISFDAPQSEIDAVIDAAHAEGTLVLASLGGASFQASTMLIPDNVDAFIDSIDAFLETNNLDGLDVDLEGSAVDSNYNPFVEKVSARLKPKGKLVTAALANWFADRISNQALAEFDFINVMAYDHCGSWTDPCEHSSMEVARTELGYFEHTRGISPDKLVLGVPFYGHCWGSGCPGNSLTYADILGLYPDAPDQDMIITDTATISYNGEATLREKAELSREYGGVMVWELGQDTTSGNLLTVLTDAL